MAASYTLFGTTVNETRRELTVPPTGAIMFTANCTDVGSRAMDEQELENAVALLIEEMEGDQGDSHEIYLRLQQLLAGMRAMGMPLPEDLVRMEAELGKEFESDAGQP
jgi:hypothetical protein